MKLYTHTNPTPRLTWASHHSISYLNIIVIYIIITYTSSQAHPEIEIETEEATAPAQDPHPKYHQQGYTTTQLRLLLPLVLRDGRGIFHGVSRYIICWGRSLRRRFCWRSVIIIIIWCLWRGPTDQKTHRRAIDRSFPGTQWSIREYQLFCNRLHLRG